jgi:hypothetical protein
MATNPDQAGHQMIDDESIIHPPSPEEHIRLAENTKITH